MIGKKLKTIIQMYKCGLKPETRRKTISMTKRQRKQSKELNISLKTEPIRVWSHESLCMKEYVKSEITETLNDVDIHIDRFESIFLDMATVSVSIHLSYSIRKFTELQNLLQLLFMGAIIRDMNNIKCFKAIQDFTELDNLEVILTVKRQCHYDKHNLE